MQRSIIYIINPISGTGNKKNLQPIIEKKMTASAIPFRVFPSVASGDYTFLNTLIKEQKITDVVIAGGDGTVSQVVSSLMDCGVSFGIIPCGSGNGLAYTATIPKQPARALDIILQGHSFYTDGFYINNQFACMLCGLGFDAKVAHDFAQQPQRGLATYIKQVVKNFFAAVTYSFQLQVNDITLILDAYFISIANSNQFGNNFTIAPKASLYDGLLDVVIVQKMNKAKLPFAIIKQLRGNNKLQQLVDDITKKNVLYFQVPCLTVRNLKYAPLHIDGEPVQTAEEVKFEVIKNCFELLQPEKN